MTTPLSPSATLTPNSYATAGSTIVARVSVYNRPAYAGKPAITGLTSITPKIVCSRTPTGVAPFQVYVSGCQTESDAGDAYADLDYRWNFGDSSGTELFTDQWNGKTVNANTDQMGPEAAYIYRTPGTYTITMTVTGKDGNGDFVTASTTNMVTIGKHYIFLGKATGGTYTLTFNGQTTSTIAYSATQKTVLAALHALSNLDATNCELATNGFFEFVGPLAGQSYTFTGDFSGLTGTTGTPQIVIQGTSNQFASISVEAESTLSTRYFDSTYTGGNGASDGTIDRPYSSVSDFRTWVLLPNTYSRLKRGSTFTLTQDVTWGSGDLQIRVDAYGTGANPIINSGAFAFEWELAWGNASNPTGHRYGDVVFSDIDFNHDTNGALFFPIGSSNGFDIYPYGMLSHVVFDNCNYRSTLDGAGARFFGMTNIENRGVFIQGLCFWNCDVDMNTATGQGLLIQMDQWFCFVGGSVYNGISTNLGKDHHIYPTLYGHQLYRWIAFAEGYKSYCINTNAIKEAEAHRWFLADGCDITGTQNGFDFSNSSNNYSGNTGYMDRIILQFNRIHSGQITSQQNGVFCYNLYRMTLRYNLWWDNNQTHWSVADVTKPWTPSIYGNLFYDGICQFRTGQIPYMVNNVFVVETAARTAIVLNVDMTVPTDIPQWECDNNIYYTPNVASPFRQGATTYITTSTWQGYGADAASTFDVDPEFPDGGTGVFHNAPTLSMTWPTGFTSLEYSLDDGDTWSAYTNGSDQSIGATLTGWQEVQFRAVTNAGSTTTITGESNTDNPWTSAEEFSAILSSNLNLLYYVIAYGGLHLVMRSEIP